MAKRPIKPTALWFIAYSGTRASYLYSGGGHYSRREAIRDHERAIGLPWKELKRNGQFAVKCIVTEATP